jgi:hypothetical protein
MKIKYILMTLVTLLISVSSCDKGFIETNTNPTMPTAINPILQLVTAQIASYDTWHYEANIVQQLQLLVGGQEEGGNRNTYSTSHSGNKFGIFYDKIKELVDIINKLKDNPDKTNVYNMARIMKVYYFQLLVDYYGDVPYFDAGKAYISGIYLPKFDNQEVIYADLVKELTEAVDGLDASKDKVIGEMYFNGDIPKWKKFGNSLLLRVGMRYTKIDGAKAKTVVTTATDPARGGVMTSNSDNVVVQHNTTQTNQANTFCTNSAKHYLFIGKPFIDFLKNNKDPRLQYISVLYSNPASATGGTANTNPADQIGCPYGYTDINVVNEPNYPGTTMGVFKYSQYNRQTIGRINTWYYVVTYAQTSLLMAEARQRGYITTGTVKDYYEAGIKGQMTQLDIYGIAPGAASPITTAQQNDYLLQPAITFDPAQALKQINEQYWVACVFIWGEAWANFRRSGYPQLSPINFPGEDPYVDEATGGDGFIHRLNYPVDEWSVNTDNVQAATTRMGGDNFGVRLFWDKK